MAHAQDAYYIPHGTHWPIFGSIGLSVLAAGFAELLNGHSYGEWMMIAGFLVLAGMMVGWFGTVIGEGRAGTYNSQVDRSFRYGMGWFIFSEVMFFAAFFGALYYTRIFSIPWLGGEGTKYLTNVVLWPNFEAHWPTNGPLHIGGQFQGMEAWGIAAINTVVLLSSGVTVTLAHWALKSNRRAQLCFWLAVTLLLGVCFLGLQAHEYIDALTHRNLSLHSGVYGSTFFMLTGFHGAHVTIGAIMLSVMLLRSLRGHFTPENHFAFEAAAWYWHFVDVVWLGLFIFVYWL